jgi:hypothetical protein
VNELYHFSSTASFLVLPPLLLLVRFFAPRRMPWWLLVLLVAFFGWVFSNLAVYFHYEMLSDQLVAAGGMNEAPEELIDRWQSDGAKRVFAYFSGWLYALIYLLPWLAAYRLAVAIRKKSVARRAAVR